MALKTAVRESKDQYIVFVINAVKLHCGGISRMCLSYLLYVTIYSSKANGLKRTLSRLEQRQSYRFDS